MILGLSCVKLPSVFHFQWSLFIKPPLAGSLLSLDATIVTETDCVGTHGQNTLVGTPIDEAIDKIFDDDETGTLQFILTPRTDLTATPPLTSDA